MTKEIVRKCKCGAEIFNRYTCKECVKKYNAEYRKKNAEKLTAEKNKHYQENKEQYIQRAKEWKAANKDKVAVCTKNYYQKNAENEKARLKAWESANSDRRKAAKSIWSAANKSNIAARCRNRQAMKAKAMPAWADKAAIARLYSLARELKESTGIDHHVDHVIPLKGKLVCGLHVPANLQVLKAKDNLIKANKYHDEY